MGRRLLESTELSEQGHLDANVSKTPPEWRRVSRWEGFRLNWVVFLGDSGGFFV